jgi:hypothetical protein
VGNKRTRHHVRRHDSRDKLAILGFVASGGSVDANSETARRLLGLLPVNLLHNVVHLLFGV